MVKSNQRSGPAAVQVQVRRYHPMHESSCAKDDPSLKTKSTTPYVTAKSF
jgi:hypothetical protein